MRRSEGDRLAERLLVITLALESALADEAWSDAGALFNERSLILDELERNSPISGPTIRRIQVVDGRIQKLMMDRALNLVSEIRRSADGLRAHKTYLPSAGLSLLSDAVV